MEGVKEEGKREGKRVRGMEQASVKTELKERKDAKRSKDAKEQEEGEKGKYEQIIERKGGTEVTVGECECMCVCVCVKPDDLVLMTHCKIKPQFSCPSLE